ncbi:MAG: VCBS repeat-containing protein [Lachnospiraceae bacterium]|nr:VCBS repeat-containing protein [Lachnospiraceae bacterium]
MNKTAGGNFDGNEEGKKSQFAMVSATAAGGLSLSVVDAVGQHASKSKELTTAMPVTDNMTQFIAKAAENGQTYNKEELQAIAYMSIVTGDFDGNGIDEIAVYNPGSATGSRIDIYALKTAPSKCDIYDMANWEIRTNIAVSDAGLVSLDAGDVNQDGIDDLVVGCDTTAAVYSGASTSPLSEKTNIDLTFGGTVKEEIMDPSVTIIREKVAGKVNTYLGILTKSSAAETSFIANGYLNVLKFDGEKKRYGVIASTTIYLGSVFTCSDPETNIYNYQNYCMLRLPLELYYVNHMFMTPYINERAHTSVRGILFSEGSLSLTDNVTQAFYQKNKYNLPMSENGKFQDVIPYDFQVADLNGSGTQTVFYKGYFSAVTYFRDENAWPTLARGSYLGAFSPGTNGAKMPMGFSSRSSKGVVYAVLNTDDDTAYMNYTGKRYFEYSDPEVLAVLASPPYFKDLLANDELSGNYAESTTSYGKSEGSGESASASATISAGVYTKVEQEISILGLGNVAQFETELSTTASFTTEYEQSREIEYSVAYSTSSGADAVVFYSIPTEIYEYETTYVDKESGEKTTYTKQMYFPKEPCVSTIELDKYNTIRQNYSELPEIGEGILDHKLGYPGSYPTGSGNYKKVKEFKGNWMAVDFTGAGGGITQEQSIAMSKEAETSFSSGVEISFSSGGGAGGVSVGYTLGSEVEAGYAMTSTSGSSFTATMQNMPAEAEEYGYGMSWKMFAHEGSYVNKNGKTVKFPVVDYMVTDVMAPPSVPENFRQDYDASTQDSIALEWDYEDPQDADTFNIYRVTNINGKKTTILAGVIGTTAGVEEEGTYRYTFIDDGTNDDGSSITLEPGFEYEYYIEAARDPENPPSLSMPGETISAFTRSDAEYPAISYSGITDNKLTVFPDRSYDIEVNIDNRDNFKQISYQWQKYDNKKGWTDIKGNKTALLSFDQASLDVAGEYRCAIDAVFYNKELQKQSVVSTYSDTITITYKMRSVEAATLKTSSAGKKPEVEVTLQPTNSLCMVTPGGSVRFILEKDSVQKVFTADLKAGAGHSASAKLSDAGDIPDLEDGNYRVSVYYGGDETFGSYTSDVQNLIIGEDAIYPVVTDVNGNITNTFAFGDYMRIDFYRYTKDESGATVATKLVDQTNQGGYSSQVLDVPDTYNKTISVRLEGVEGTQKFNYTYTVTKRPIELGISNKQLTVGDVEDKLPAPVLLNDSTMGYSLYTPIMVAAIKYMNATKTQTITLDNNTPAGTYYAELVAKDNQVAACYDMELYSSEIKIGAKRYDVTVQAADYEGAEAGTVIMTKPEEISDIKDTTVSYESGTRLRLKAKANTGYVFDHWEIKEGDNPATTAADAILTKNINPVSTKIKAVFASNCYPVTIDETMSKGGTIELPEGFESGKVYQVGTVLEFNQKEGEEISPDCWIVATGSKTSYVYGAKLTLTVPESAVTIYPVFKGKPCKVSFNDGALVYYTYFNDQEEEITERIVSGNSVPKGSKVDLKVGNGYVHYKWLVNGEQIAENKDASFTIEKDTVITLSPIEAANKPEPQLVVEPKYTKVGDIPLPQNWKWDDADAAKAIPEDGLITAKAVYVGTDAGNYENEIIEIAIGKKECQHPSKETVKAKAATCVDNGYTGDVVCKDCRKILQSGTVINATGHEYGTPTYTWSADGKSCTATVVCKKAGCKATDAGHTLTETATISEIALDQNGAKMNVAIFKKEPFVLQFKMIGQLTQPAASTPSGEKTSAETEVKAPEKVTSVKAKSKKAAIATISWGKVDGAAGYEVQLSLKKNFKKIAKKASGKKAKITVKKLKKGKTYYVRVRAYTLDASKKKVYGAYSDKVKVKIKK